MSFLIPRVAPGPAPEEKKFRTVAVPEPLGRDQYSQVEERLGYTFREPNLLEHALTHRSVPASTIQSGETRSDYERLEFLGDAVFDLAVAHLLLDLHPAAREGDLSKMR